MAQIISQGLTVPADLADGRTASASQITPLYGALNAFVLPDTVGVLQPVFDSGNTTYAFSTGSSQDWSFNGVNADRAILGMFSFTTTGTSPTFTYRVNAGSVTGAMTLGTAGAGVVFFVIGGRYSDAIRGLLVLEIDTTAATTLRATTATSDLPTTSLTSFGVALGAAGTTVTIRGVKLWREG